MKGSCQSSFLVRSHFLDKSFAATIRVEVLYNSKQQQNTRSVRALRKSSELTEEGPKRRKQCGFLTDFRQNYSTVKSENIMQPPKMERFSKTVNEGFHGIFHWLSFSRDFFGNLLPVDLHKSLVLVLQVFGILEDFKESTDIFSCQCPRCFIGTLLDWKQSDRHFGFQHEHA